MLEEPGMGHAWWAVPAETQGCLGVGGEQVKERTGNLPLP